LFKKIELADRSITSDVVSKYSTNNFNLLSDNLISAFSASLPSSILIPFFSIEFLIKK
jgi:hypothetical protein